jgi:VWFA-related protein
MWQRIPIEANCALFFCSALFICIAAVANVPAQVTYPTERPRRALPAEPQPEEVIRIDTNLVSVDVTALDAAGRPVRTLRKEDFKVFEDGVQRPIALFDLERREDSARPVAVVFLLDLSGSMSPEEMTRLQSAMREFSNRLVNHPAAFAVMTFGMRVKTLQSFTTDRQKLERAFDRLAREPNGLSTHTYDAVDDAIRLIERKAPLTLEHQTMKRAVVVITDGFPVGDTVSPETVIERANAANVSVFAVTLPSYSRLLTSPGTTPLPTPLDISGLVEKTGGISVYADAPDLGPLFRSLAAEVTSAYVIGFYPPEENRGDGKFHTVRVEATGGLILRQSRPGYKAFRKQ